MDKEGFNVSSSTIKAFMETCVGYKEFKPKETKKSSTACESHSKRGGNAKPNIKLAKRLTMARVKDSPQHNFDGQGRHHNKYQGYCNHTTE
eukprot:3154329-Ditylum_brightwellii.AAC.1